MFDMMEVECQCQDCGRKFYLDAKFDQWNEYFKDKKERRSVQEIFPEFTASQRELLISGICKHCYNQMTGQFDNEN